MDSKKPDGAQAGQSPSEQQAFFLVPMQESDCSLARSAPVLPAWSGSRGTWTACLLSPGKQALPARCSLATTLSAVTASTSSSSSLEHDALCWPASFRLPRAGSACAGKGRRESVVCCSSCRHTTSRAQQGGPTTRGTWTRDGKRRQAGPLVGFAQALHLPSRRKRGGFPSPRTPHVPASGDT